MAMRLKWSELLAMVQQVMGNILLYGPPGTGKTFLAHWLGEAKKKSVYAVTCSEDMSAQELVGHFVPKGGEFVWHNGPALLAWERGGVLNLNEIDRCSGGVEICLHSLLDDHGIAKLTLPDGHTARPRPGFQAVATMNGTPDMLPPALLDRFQVRVLVDAPSEGALRRIKSEVIRKACEAHYRKPLPSLTYRQFASVDQLIQNGIEDRLAFLSVFGDNWEEVYQAFKASEAKEGGKK